MGQKATDAMVQSQHDCMVVRVCQEAYDECTVRISWILEQELSSELL